MKNFKRTNERMKENNTKNIYIYREREVRGTRKRIAKNDRSTIFTEQRSSDGNGKTLGNVYMTRYEKGTARSNTKFIQNRVFTLSAYSDLVAGCNRSRYFLASDSVCMAQARYLSTECLLCQKSTLCTLSSCTNDGVSVLSSTHIFSFQYEFCGAVVVRSCDIVAYAVS